MTQNSWLLSRLELRDNHLYLAGQRGATPIPTQQWTRVTLRTGTTLKLSVNGKPELSAPAELSLENTLIIGRGFEGRMDEIVLRP
ncbi:hypothetical protein [Bryobacter aggregatus]|uniref:hypothetical protein n=1 Tax=Bryobacter aggregatus TaxID=360054 RepID=UPI0004E28C32|nr:hypothetical protein [Bryobacter aggregatus]